MMTSHGNKALRILAITCLLLAAVPFTCNAMFVVQTKIATGTITSLQNNDITLDYGITYYPASPDAKLHVGVGNQVTLRYFKAINGKYLYTKVAKGRNSLRPLPPPTTPRKKGFK